MDSFAVGLKVAQKLIEGQVLDGWIEKRYESYRDGIGKAIVEGKTDFHKLEEYALGLSEIRNESGRLEQIKATINQYLLNVVAGK
jgi:xylose isomerase